MSVLGTHDKIVHMLREQLRHQEDDEYYIPYDFEALAKEIYEDTTEDRFYFLTEEEYKECELDTKYGIDEELIGEFVWFDGEFPVNCDTIDSWASDASGEHQIKLEYVSMAFDVALEKTETPVEFHTKYDLAAKERVFLDTETTGLSAREDRIVEIAIVSEDGQVLLNSLVNPGQPIPSKATSIHGITDEMVANAPTLEQLEPAIVEALKDKILVVYNLNFDLGFLPKSALKVISGTACAMKRFASWFGEENSYYGNPRWQKLGFAADIAGHKAEGEAHRALEDTQAARSVWNFLNDQPHPYQTEVFVKALRGMYREKREICERLSRYAFSGFVSAHSGIHSNKDMLKEFSEFDDFINGIKSEFDQDLAEKNIESGKVAIDWIQQNLMSEKSKTVSQLELDWIELYTYEEENQPYRSVFGSHNSSSLDDVPF